MTVMMSYGNMKIFNEFVCVNERLIISLHVNSFVLFCSNAEFNRLPLSNNITTNTVMCHSVDEFLIKLLRIHFV